MRELSAFLGIKIENRSLNEFYYSQFGLIDKVLKAPGTPDCNPYATLLAVEPLGSDTEGNAMNESWENAPMIGALMYLTNTRPDIAHMVHACARYTHNTKKCMEESDSPIRKSKVHEDNAACPKFVRLPRLIPRI